MRELYYGGWLAPNIFYFGAAGVVNLNFLNKGENVGLKKFLGEMKLFGMSGIFKQYSFYKDHPHLPFDQDSKRSCYHTRQLELIRGLLLDERVDIGISHDWPRGAHKFGNYEELIKVKPYFEKDFNSGRFGNPCTALLMRRLFWFSGHCHVNYTAVWDNEAKTVFKAVDKCINYREYLTFCDFIEGKVDLEGVEDFDITIDYDIEWISVIKATEKLFFEGIEKHCKSSIFKYDFIQESYILTAKGKEFLSRLKSQKENELTLLRSKNFKISPAEFSRTIDNLEKPDPSKLNYLEPEGFSMNSQTLTFLKKLNLLPFKYKNFLFTKETKIGKRESNSEEIDISSDGEFEDLDDVERRGEMQDQGDDEMFGDVDMDEIEKKLKI